MQAHVYPEGCVFNSLNDIKEKKVTVMGLGLNGGGEACVRFFLKYGAIVTVTDMKTKEQLKPTIDSIAKDKTLPLENLTYVLGEHRIQDFSEADCVIKNPGVKYEGNKFLAAAKAIETDISIFLHFTKAPIIAVTGSKGKSSTVSAIDYGLKAAGSTSFLGGNITVSPLTFLEQTTKNTPVVLELSSWQLRDLRGRKALKPKIAIITKIVPDHQNFYGAMDPYVDDKRLIYADQDENDFAIFDADDDGYLKETSSPKEGCTCWGDDFASEAKAKVLRYSSKEFTKPFKGVFQKNKEGFVNINAKTECLIKSLMVPGPHNRINVLNASLVLYLMKVEPDCIQKVMSVWTGIPHRLEYFYEWDCTSGKKIAFYNDSCSTVPEAAAAASQSFESRVIFITGGTDKNLDFLPLARTLNGESGTKFPPEEIYLLSGTGTDKLVPLLDERGVKYEGPFDSLEVLLSVLKANLETGRKNKDAEESEKLNVVFSPGCTSFGMFANEFDRGNSFKKYVEKLFQ
ncbi:MAG: UDP-N-acetylmuramoyl-L-alanine--D-glutamate ligase [Treponema sp.]|nr:UDP-N-acetylmuramoyl-L-alanine--D-glutamate ligase [Treponema sp.]